MEKYAIVIDTNILGEPNRYDFKNGFITVLLKSLKDFSNIDVFLPSIVFDEIRTHIKDSLHFDFFESKSKYFKDNVSSEKLCDKITQKIYEELDEFIKKYKLKILDCYKYMNMKEVNNWYFNKEMPFEITKPKEFPDAMIVSSIINFFNESNYTDVYILSNDNGFKKGIEKHSEYKVYKKIGPVMKKFLDYSDSDLRNIEQYINENKILYSLNFINFSSADSGDYIDVSVDNYNIKEIEVLYVDKERYDINIIYDVNVSGEICIFDPYESIYDREDSKYYCPIYKGTDKLELKNVNACFSIYKDEKEKLFKCESIMSTEVDITKYLDNMDIYSCG